MKIIALILSLLLLTSCSNPDTSGGVTLSRGGDDANEFPNGSCEGQHENTPDLNTGCGWIYNSVRQGYYIMPGADLSGADLSGAKLDDANLNGSNLRDANLKFTELRYANLSGADFRYADLRGVRLDHANLISSDLRDADLSDAWLSYANLSGADLRSAILDRVGFRAAPGTICPNGQEWGNRGNDCGF